MSIRFRAAADERFMRINEWVSDGHALVLLVSGLPQIHTDHKRAYELTFGRIGTQITIR